MAADPQPSILTALLHDARHEFLRAAEALPAPGRGGAIGRLNSGGWIVAHVARQDDAIWNVTLQGLDPDPWLAEQDVGYGSEPSTPPFDEALDALRRVLDRSREYIDGLRSADLARVVRHSAARGVDDRLADVLARQTGHMLTHAGELSALGSLVGAPDLGLPGRLQHVREAADRLADQPR